MHTPVVHTQQISKFLATCSLLLGYYPCLPLPGNAAQRENIRFKSALKSVSMHCRAHFSSFGIHLLFSPYLAQLVYSRSCDTRWPPYVTKHFK